jgi:hypothetical protein
MPRERSELGHCGHLDLRSGEPLRFRESDGTKDPICLKLERLFPGTPLGRWHTSARVKSQWLDVTNAILNLIPVFDFRQGGQKRMSKAGVRKALGL